MKKQTRGSKGNGTIRKRTDSRSGKTYTWWEGRVTVGRDPKTGKQKRRVFTGPTQQAVLEKMRAASVEVDTGTYTDPCNLTIAQWMDIWSKTYLGKVKPHTVSSYTTQIKNHINPALGHIKMETLNTHTIQGFYNSLISEKHLSPKTVKNVHGVLHKALQQAVKNQYIRTNPCDACELPRVEKKEIHPLNEVEVNAFLDAIQNSSFRTLFTVDLFTGMREGEILGLKWEDCDFKDGTILIQRQLHKAKEKGGEYSFTSLKNDKSRLITPAPQVMDLLKAHKREQAEQRLSVGPLWEDSGLVFTNKLGRHLAFPTVYENFKRIVKSIGRPDARFHDLRHTFAVVAIRSGVNIKTISTMMGHSTVAFTMDTYAFVTAEMHKESAEKMKGFISNAFNL